MSGSRKLKLRAAPRAPPRRPSAAHTKQAEPVPLANRFQELLEQDEAAASPSPPPPPPPPPPPSSQSRHGPTTSTSMAQRLQHMLGESSPFGENLAQSKRNVAPGFVARRGPEALWNFDEVEAVESDTSDHEEGTRGSAMGMVVPMGQRLDDLLQEDRSRSRQDKPKQRQKGKRPLLEPKCVSNSDDIEACDIYTGTPTYPDDRHVPTTSKPQILPRIAEQFQEALMAAPPSFDFSSLPSVQQFPRNQDFSTRLQRILQAEKVQHAEIAKGAPGGTPLDSIQVQIMKKSLEGRLVTCKCQVIQAPSKWTGSDCSPQVQVIFNSKVAAELEIDVGLMVRVNPPWREVTLAGTTTRVILCTYFCEAVY